MCTGSKLRWKSVHRTSDLTARGSPDHEINKFRLCLNAHLPKTTSGRVSVSLRSAFNLSSFPPPGFVNIADDHEPGKNHCDASLMDKKNRDCKRSAIFHRRPTRRGNWFNRALMCRTREGTKEGTLPSPTDPVLEGNHFANTRVIPPAENITPSRARAVPFPYCPQIGFTHG